MLFRKKPVIVDTHSFLPALGQYPEGVELDGTSPTGWGIFTLEDTVRRHEVTPGDWIITGVQGERYSCKPDIFMATYEPVAP